MEPKKLNALLIINDIAPEAVAEEAGVKLPTVKAVIYATRRTGPMARRVMEVIERKTGKTPDELWQPEKAA